MRQNLSRHDVYAGLGVVFRELGHFRRDATILAALGILSALTGGVTPYLTGRLFDAIVTPSVLSLIGFQLPLFTAILLVWLLVELGTSLSSWYTNLTRDRISENVRARYVSSGFTRLLDLPMSFHAKHRTGDYTNKINQSVNSIDRISHSVIIPLAPQFLSIIVALVIVFSLNWFLALILAGGMLIYVGLMIPSAGSLAAMESKVHGQYNKAYGESYDAVYNIRAIKQAAAERYQSRKIWRLHQIAAISWLQVSRVWARLSLYQNIIVLAARLIIFVISIGEILRGTMSLGDLIAFNGYAGLVFGPFVSLGSNWQTLHNGVIAINKAEKILNQPQEIYRPEGAPILESLRGKIAFKNVSFYYEKSKPILKNISLVINPGETVALVGESGVGKSTLVDLISGYYFPRGGQLSLDDHPIKTLDLSFLRSQIAVVPQEVVLFNDSILTNIKYGNFGKSLREVALAAEQAHALEFIEKFPRQWKQLVGERGVKLSVGQKQRVAIARAILRNPKILILDEPTSALDAKSESIIQESLEKLMRGRTTIIIAHRLSTVRKADKIVVIQQGEIVEIGKHDELLANENGLYRELYNLQIGLHA